jgi:hypothetical protein
MRKKRKKKLTRGQIWWRNLTPNEQAAYIDRKVEEKAKLRLERTKRWLKDNSLKFDCSVCIHGLSGSCSTKDELPNGCEYWANAETSERVDFDLLPPWTNRFKHGE